jgi:hypothetical protein
MAGMSGISLQSTSASQVAGGLDRAALRSIPAEAAAAAQAGPAYKLDLSDTNDWNDPVVRKLKRTGRIECQTCKARKYQDGSNDPGVSFKAPGHISPEASAATVMAHEQEHVANEEASARSEDRKVVYQSVRLFSAVCPECGKVYASGGETKTVTKADSGEQTSAEQTPAERNKVDMAV